MVKDDMVSRVWNKIDRLAKAKGMTRQEFITWSEAECCRSNISGFEYDLIFAYQVSRAVERLKINNYDLLAEAIESKYSWLSRLKGDFNKVDKAMQHLQEVCEYVKDKEDTTYQYEWLLDYNDVLFDKIIEESKGKNKKGKLIRIA